MSELDSLGRELRETHNLYKAENSQLRASLETIRPMRPGARAASVALLAQPNPPTPSTDADSVGTHGQPAPHSQEAAEMNADEFLWDSRFDFPNGWANNANAARGSLPQIVTKVRIFL